MVWHLHTFWHVHHDKSGNQLSPYRVTTILTIFLMLCMTSSWLLYYCRFIALHLLCLFWPRPPWSAYPKHLLFFVISNISSGYLGGPASFLRLWPCQSLLRSGWKHSCGAEVEGTGTHVHRALCSFTQHFVVSILRHSVCNRLTLLGASLFDFHWYRYAI